MKTSLVAASVLCAIALSATPKTANAAQRTACQMLPAATAQTILGYTVMSPGPGAEPTVTGGSTSYQCFYMGGNGGASLFIYYDATAAQASAQASMNMARFARMGKTYGANTIAGSKGNIAFMVTVRNPSDVGKLKALLAAAMRNS